MIDVLPVLLIVFMAIAPSQSSGLDAAVLRNSMDKTQPYPARCLPRVRRF
jgi:biopolymer transport protein ExbD